MFVLTKKKIAVMMTAVLLLCTAAPARAAAVRDVDLGLGGVGAPATGPAVSDPNMPSSHSWKGSSLCFGQDQQWLVLQKGSSATWLIADDVLKEDGKAKMISFDSDDNDWKTSDLKSWLNGGGYLGSDSRFSDFERGMISGGISIPYAGMMCRRDLGFSGQSDPDGTREATEPYWLQDPAAAGYAKFICWFGSVFASGATVSDDTLVGVRPLLYMKNSPVFFSSAASMAKGAFSAVGTQHISAAGSGIMRWQMTAHDGNTSFAISAPSRAIEQRGSLITVRVTRVGNARQSAYRRISAILTDSRGTVCAYGFARESAAGPGKYSFRLPGSLRSGSSYTMRVFAESGSQNAGNHRMDFASNAAAYRITASSAARPGRVRIRKLKPARRRLCISWKKVAQSTGYQVILKPQSGGGKTIRKITKKTYITVRKLKKKKYTVRVRARRINSAGGFVYGRWSRARTVSI